MSTMTDDLTAAVAEAEARYVAANPASHGLHVRHWILLPRSWSRVSIKQQRPIRIRVRRRCIV